MLSIAQMSSAGQGDYYLSLAAEDYYLEGGEPPGQWMGEGASAFGLAGKVLKGDLRELLNGYHPQTGASIVKNAGSPKRQSGWDLTFSAPKSVSVAWSQSTGETRLAIESAHNEAVRAAISYLESESGVSRRGSGGGIREGVGLTVATFEHGSSRAQDPTLHTHALVINGARRKDGSFGAIESRPIYRNKMTAGALYRAELAARLERDHRLGLASKRYKSWFELEGVSTELKEEFSTRRAEIEAALEESGFKGARAAEIATLSTRSRKDAISRSELFSCWREKGAQLGWDESNLKELLNQAPDRLRENHREAVVRESLESLTSKDSHFSKSQLVRAIAERAQGRGIDAREVQDFASKATESERTVFLCEREGEKFFTTPEMIKLEEALLDRIEGSRDVFGIKVKDEVLEATFRLRPTMSSEQKNAVVHIASEKGSVKHVTGMAGTGKSYMLGAAKDALEHSGYEVIGSALSGKAARGLQESAGIESETLHRILSELEKGTRRLSTKTALIVDEAGMVGTRQLEEVVRRVTDANAKLVLVGDAKQLQAIDAGGAFKAIGKRIEGAELTSIRRQREDWSRKAVEEISSGQTTSFLEEFGKRGLLTIKENSKSAMNSLIYDWSKDGISNPRGNLILAGSNSDVQNLNERAQGRMHSAGILGENSISINNQVFFEKDRVLFTKNSRLFGVRNGDLGTISEVTTSQIKVTLDQGDKINIPLSEYKDLKLGYAVTTHKAQGVTSKNSFVFLGGPMQDRELSYVQLSRARETTHLYVDEMEAGEQLSALRKTMKRSRQKNLAKEIQNNDRRNPIEL